MVAPIPQETPRKVNVLVCSANVGNAEPDIDSFASWIPHDGNFLEVVKQQKYPLKEAADSVRAKFKAAVGDLRKQILIQHKKDENGKDSEQSSDDEEDKAKKFDIIVVGMQEATFEVNEIVGRTGFIPTTAIKAQKAFAGLTTAKDHLKLTVNRREKPVSRPSFVGKGPNNFRDVRLAKSLPPGDLNGLNIDDGSGGDSSAGEEESQLGFEGLFDEVSASTQRNLLANTDTKVLHALFSRQLPSYTHAVSYQRGQMRLMIYYNEDRISLDVLSVEAQNTGIGGLANKGGIVSEVLVDGTTRMSFFTAHLEAHEGEQKYKTRCSSVADIFKGTASRVTQCRVDASLASHFTFAMGDLNFRTRLPDHEPGSESHLQAAHELANTGDWGSLYRHDELCSAIEKNHCFSGFTTPNCPFPPTFKVQRQMGHSYIKSRSPSYTDRILFTTGHHLQKNMKVLAYEPIDDFTSSDHKPIRGAFEVQLNSKLKWRPRLSTKIESRRSIRHSSTGSPITKFLIRSPTEKPIDHQEYLNIFISSLKVHIDKEQYENNRFETNAPSPFVCFVSTPAKALEREVGSWEKAKRKLKMITRKNYLSNSGGENAWPKTRRKHDTFDASWEHEDVHFKVRTHTKDGFPIDLSGAMIHVTVFDGTVQKKIGSFSLNLAHLIVKSREHLDLKKTKNNQDETKKSHRRNLSSMGAAENVLKRLFHIPSAEDAERNADGETPEMEGSATNNGIDGLTRGPSIELLRRTTHAWLGTLRRSLRDPIEQDEVRSMKLDRPLRKCGVVVGRISFTIDAWWLTDKAADEKLNKTERLDDTTE